MKINVIVNGTSPILMHNPRMVDPDFEINREIKLLTGKRKKTDDDLKQIEKLEWYGGLYHEGDTVVQPTSKLRKCLVEAARINKLGKQVERALSFDSLNVPLIYDGPRTVDELWKSRSYVSRLSVGVNGKRVMRTRPQFTSWALSVDGFLLEDVLNPDEFIHIAEMAGRAVGIGDNRVNGYGRFTVQVKVQK